MTFQSGDHTTHLIERRITSQRESSTGAYGSHPAQLGWTIDVGLIRAHPVPSRVIVSSLQHDRVQPEAIIFAMSAWNLNDLGFYAV